MSRKKKVIIYTVLLLSILFNVLTLSLDTYPYLYPKIKNKYFKENTVERVDDNTEAIIISSSMKMVKSSKPVMAFSEPKGLTQRLLSLNSITTSKEFRKYNYPKAFLYYGTAKLAANKADGIELIEFKNYFDELINNNGSPSFALNRIDQVPFGLASLILYEKYKEKKYLKFANIIYEYIINSIEKDKLIPYREGQESLLNDMLGMAVPFLVEYSKINTNEQALEIAKTQLEYYINFGVDKETFLPTHAINREEKIKLGPVNWGRGIGWYFIALSYYYHETGEYDEEYNGLISTLNKLRNSEDLWSQFPGSRDKFDASTSTLFLYSMLLNEPNLYTKDEVLKLLKPYLSVEGEILQTSGDTYSVNRYSNTFGKSELSQGILMLILSLY